MMDAKEFASAYGEAFGPAAGLPLLFWYSDGPVRAVPKVEGCFFKALAEAREGSAVSLNAANIGCGGGKFYTGFAPMPPFVPAFVSQKEHYKQTPEMVLEFIGRLGVPEASGAWLNFARIDTPQAAEAFGTADGALFFATPDILSGLVSWAVYDNNADDAVCAPFGSGCSAVVTQAVRENRRGGRSVFLALFDPSVRPWVDASELGFVAPMSRLREMCGTMRASCLFGTHAWNKVRVRINGGKKKKGKGGAGCGRGGAHGAWPISGPSKSWRDRDSRSAPWRGPRWVRWSGACMPRGTSNRSRSGCAHSINTRFSAWSISR